MKATITTLLLLLSLITVAKNKIYAPTTPVKNTITEYNRASNPKPNNAATVLKEVNETCNELSSLAQTFIPDVNFEVYLEANGYGDGMINQFVPTASINGVAILDVSNQGIADLTGIQDFTALDVLICWGNNLTSLDVSSNTNLRNLWCYDNNLSSLDVRNGNNTEFAAINFNTTNNPSLFCIDVDDVAYSTATWTGIDPWTGFSTNCSNTTYVPDDNFEAYLEANGMGNGIANDNYVTTANISGVTTLDVSFQDIADLTGIEDFIALTSLNCTSNNLSSLDVSANTALQTLYCYYNNLTSLDVTANTALKDLGCGVNNLSSLDVSTNTALEVLNCTSSNLSTLDVSANTALNELHCDNNNLTSLDVSANIALTFLGCHENNLSSLDVSANTALTTLFCYTNNLNSLDVSANTALKSLAFYENNISSIDVSANTALKSLRIWLNNINNLDVSTNTALELLSCSNNNLSSLDVSANTVLKKLFCKNNNLTSLDLSANTDLRELVCNNNNLNNLDIRNGNNTLIVNSEFNTTNNPNLFCIDVDDVAYSTATWTDIDPWTGFGLDCSNTTYVPDDNFEAYLEANGMGNGIANDNFVTTTSINGVTSLTVSSLSIADLTGIEDFIALQTLNCASNTISALDVTQNTALTSLDCSNNQLTGLNLSQNTILENLSCDNNSLTGLSLFQNTALAVLDCSENQLTSLDLTQNTALQVFDCRNNVLSVLNVKNGNNVNILFYNSLFNPNLSCIEVDDAVYSTTNWTNIDPASSFSEDCGVKIWENNAWSGGAPTLSENAIIRDDYNTNIQGANIEANSIIIDPNYTLTVSSGDYLFTKGNITVNGSLIVEHEGSVVQLDEAASVTNNGIINVIKTTPVATGNSFSILGSPMSGTTRNGSYVANNVVMNHDTSLFNLDGTVTTEEGGNADHFADAEGDNWLFMIGAAAINPTEGYLVGPTDQGVIDNQYDLTYYEGTLNNGAYQYLPIWNGSRDESSNILSNPYPSAIDAVAFLNDNNVLASNVYFWEHLTAPDVNYPGYRSENWDMGDISIMNVTGVGTAAPNDVTMTPPSQYIASGQGFGVKIKVDPAIFGNLPFQFNNSQRVLGPNTGYRSSENNVEKLYIYLKNETYNLRSSMAVAFTDQATNGYDEGFETKRLATPISIYSVIDDHEIVIQARNVFTTDQVIPLGFRTMVEEEQTYTISLGDIEGANITQATVYLQDNLLNTVTNLSEDSYTFTSNESNQKDRFVLVFTEEQLGNNDMSLEAVSLYPNPTANIVNIASPLATITNIEVYDVQGRIIASVTVADKSTYQLDMSTYNTAMYFVKVYTESGTITKQIIKK